MNSFGAKAGVQHTINRSIVMNGKGVHSDKAVSIILHPADANTGIQFQRITETGDRVDISALHSSVGATELCTIIGDPKGIFVATIEHLMAAIYAMGVDNLLIEIDGPETPVMDGSSIEFVDAMNEVGLMAQAARRQYIKIEETIRVEMGSSWAELRPCEKTRFDVEIDFEDRAIGRQRFMTDLDAKSFANDIARARTFGFMRDVKQLWAAGYALGSTLDNSVVIGEEGIVNPEGLRFKDEFVRHKLLDAVGDLALMGSPFLGEYRSYRGGHKLNFMMVKALFEQKGAWSYVKMPTVPQGSPAYREMANEPAVALSPAKT